MGGGWYVEASGGKGTLSTSIRLYRGSLGSPPGGSSVGSSRAGTSLLVVVVGCSFS